MIYYKKKSLIKKVINKIIKKKEFLKFPLLSFFKRLFFFISIFLFILYSIYLFLLPKYLNNSIIEDAINNFILKETQLVLDVEKIKINPNYKFDINLKAESIKIKYPNKKDFIVILKPDIDVNLVSLMFGFIDLNKIKSDEIKVNVEFTKDKKYSCFKFFSLKDAKTKLKLRNINLFAKTLVFNLYDENIKKNFSVETDKIQVLMPECKKPIVIKTKGVAKSYNHKILDFDLNLSIKLNQDLTGKFKQKLIKLNYNPFAEADKYRFYANSKIDLKVNLNDDRNNAIGEIALNDYSFEINGLKLPKNNLVLNFKNNKITTNCDFKFLKEQYIKIKSIYALNKNLIEANLNSNELNLLDLKDVFCIIGKIFNFKYDSNSINVAGLAAIDVYIKSDFKTISSNGKLIVKNAVISDKKTGLTIKDINSDVNFANNEINILNASAYVNSAKFNLKGKIDSKARLNLKINSEELNIAQVLMLVKEMPFSGIIVPKLNDYIFKSGFLKINTEIFGTMNKPLIYSKSSLSNLKLVIKKCGYDIFVPKFELKFLENDILIPDTKIIIKDIPFVLSGKIKNYKNTQSETVLNVTLKLPKDNKIIRLKNEDVNLNCVLNVKNNKMTISSCSVADSIVASGEVVNLNKGPILNIKLSFLDGAEFILPQFENFQFNPKGNIVIVGTSDKPSVTGNLTIKDIYLADIGLKINDLFLNIQDSKFYLNIVDGKIFDSKFSLTSNAQFQKDKLIIDAAQVSSVYVHMQNIEKYLKNSKSLEKIKYEIKELKANIATLETPDVVLNSLVFEADIKDDILNIKHFSADALNGKIDGFGVFDILKQKVKINLKLNDLNIRQLSSKLKELSIAASGKLSATIKAEFIGFDIDSILSTFNGDIKFDIKNGELAQFAKLERFLQAGNVLSQSIFKSNFLIFAKQSTGDFKIIEGDIKISDAIANIIYIKTQGSNMSLNIEGYFNLVNQNINAKILGRIPNSSVNVLSNFDKKDSMTSIEKRFSTYLADDELKKIPKLAYQVGEIQTREFVVLINGLLNNLNSIREFKWIIK